MWRRIIIYTFVLVALSSGGAEAGVADTVHNLSAYDDQGRLCVFCHTPHNASPAVPLWNHYTDETTIYDMYGSDFPSGHSSLEYSSIPPAPTGSSKLCLSCHDGTVAVDRLNGMGPDETLIGDVEGKFKDGNLISQARLGTNLTNDHPISIPIKLDIGNPDWDELKAPNSNSPVKLENGLVQCSSCHDPHSTEDKFLVATPDYGYLCEECHDHQLGGQVSYGQSAHGTSTATWPPNDDYLHPLYDQRKDVNQWACLGCHDIHGDENARPTSHLLRVKLVPEEGDPIDVDKETGACVNCHNGPVTPGASTVAPDIRGEFLKTYTHPIQDYTDDHYVKEFPEGLKAVVPAHVECVDCHDPHYGQDRPDTDRPREIGDINAGPELKGIRGWQFLGFQSTPNADGLYTNYNEDEYYLIKYEFELCLKCHGSKANMDFERDHMERMDDHFNPLLNVTTHGVMAPSNNRNPYVWKGATREFQESITKEGWDSGQTIACSDCHGNESTEPDRILGPHGSNWGSDSDGARWLLRKSGVTDNYGQDFICYMCHDVNVYGPQPTVQTKRDVKNYPDAYRSGFVYHVIAKHQERMVTYPMGIPAITCFACHGDYSNLMNAPTTGGLHGANERTNRPETTTGVHFLNGFAIEIKSTDQEVLSTTGTVSCGDTTITTPTKDVLGCTHHSTETYDRPGV